MAKTIQSHGKYHHMFPMMFYCEFCECVFECESINDVDICTLNSHVFAQTRCPECEEFVTKVIAEIIPEVNDYE